MKKLALTKLPKMLPALPSTTPPPRKEDIINAMVERARVKHGEEVASLHKKRDAAEKELRDALLAELKVNPQSFTMTVHGMYHAPEIEYSLDIVPAHIRKLRESVRSVPSLQPFDAGYTRRKIRDQFNASPDDRVKALLSNEDAVKAIDAALERIVK